ncbi:4-alpha-glucanotransferase [Christensenellaceae bacterium]|nr:4-alpha-glucanotransferase [Christensenellaceae bacterium]BDF61311.1 4-alpha-glucanotransferase [Christensenellaceae bacterium]
MKRGSGVLLHITSLPSPYGIGTIGKAAYDFVDALYAARQSYWQMLPTPPTGYADSPYQGLSAFANNPYLIDLDFLIEEGLLHEDDVAPLAGAGQGVALFKEQLKYKDEILKKAYRRGIKKYKDEFTGYKYTNASWLFDYSLFAVFRKQFGSQGYFDWDKRVAFRDQAAVMKLAQEHEEEIEAVRFAQFLFEKQWFALKEYANKKGISLIGDIPIYVAPDSAETWAHPELFMPDDMVAGTPPDKFSKQGQFWENPLYDWDYMKAHGFRWWVDRVKRCFAFFDIIRIDHFRGFEAFYAIPRDKKPKDGHWIKGPGHDLFEAIKREIPYPAIIAEDLGHITQEVRDFLGQCGFPGNKVLQFAFDTPNSEFLPHNYPRHCVVYTGTHDNDTVKGWFSRLDEESKERLFAYLGHECTKNEAAEELERLAMMSVADLCIIPMQDLLNLGPSARMNYPGRALGYWKWRMKPGAFNDKLIAGLRDMTETYGRACETEE